MEKKTDDNFDFEKSIDELSTIVEQLEKGGISLQESLKQFEAGVKLTRQCQDALSNAEQKVKILQDEQLKDFQVDDE